LAPYQVQFSGPGGRDLRELEGSPRTLFESFDTQGPNRRMEADFYAYETRAFGTQDEPSRISDPGRQYLFYVRIKTKGRDPTLPAVRFTVRASDKARQLSSPVLTVGFGPNLALENRAQENLTVTAGSVPTFVPVVIECTDAKELDVGGKNGDSY